MNAADRNLPPPTHEMLVDAKRMGEVSQEIALSEGMHQMELGLWRMPGYFNFFH